MATPTNRPIVVVAAVLFLVCFALLIAATADPEFLVDYPLYIGAFQSCVGGRSTGCSYYGTGPGSCPTTALSCSEWQAFQAFLLIGVITLGFLTISACLTSVRPNIMLDSITLMIGIVSNISILISWALFTDMSSGESSFRGASYDLEVAAWVISFVGLFIFAAGTKFMVK